MSNNSVKNHPNNPACQGFNITGSKNRTKRNSWWNPTSKAYFRNRKDAKQD